MTRMVFIVVDNHNLKKGKKYDEIYKTESFKELKNFVEKKGIGD